MANFLWSNKKVWNMRKREKKAFVSFFFAKLCVRNEIFTFQSQKLLKNSRVEVKLMWHCFSWKKKGALLWNKITLFIKKFSFIFQPITVKICEPSFFNLDILDKSTFCMLFFVLRLDAMSGNNNGALNKMVLER